MPVRTKPARVQPVRTKPAGSGSTSGSSARPSAKTPARRRLATTGEFDLLVTPVADEAWLSEDASGRRRLVQAVDDPDLDRVLARITQGRPANTARAYGTYIRCWWALVRRQGAELHDQALLRGWLQAMARPRSRWLARHPQVAVPKRGDPPGVSPATLRVVVAAIRVLLATLNRPPLDGATTAWIGGLVRDIAAPPDQAPAILRDQLGRLVELAMAEPVKLRALRNRALLLLGFAGALRRSELTGLRVDDVQSLGTGLRLRIRASKTDRTRSGQLIPIHRGKAAGRCPVRALRQWLDASGIADGPLFRAIDAHGNLGAQALRPDAVRQILQRYGGSGLRAHGLRAGLVTQALLDGATRSQVRVVTRHADDRMLSRYERVVDLEGQGPGAVL